MIPHASKVIPPNVRFFEKRTPKIWTKTLISRLFHGIFSRFLFWVQAVTVRDVFCFIHFAVGFFHHGYFRNFRKQQFFRNLT